MSVKSNEMRAVRPTAATYTLPVVRFGKGNQILQIRQSSIENVDELETELAEATNTAGAQNSEVLQLFTNVDTLFNNVTIITNETQTALAEATALQLILNQINQLLTSALSFSPYYNPILPAQTKQGVGTTNSTLPNASQVYTFTPDANGENAKPTAFMILGIPPTTETTRFQVTWNMSFVGDIRQDSPSELFVDSWANTSNGGIIYTTVTTGSTLLYASQNGTIGQTYIPSTGASGDAGSFTGCALLSFTDIITVPVGIDSLSFNFFISNHYSMTLSSTIYSQIGFYLVEAFPLPTFNDNAVPALVVLKL